MSPPVMQGDLNLKSQAQDLVHILRRHKTEAPGSTPHTSPDLYALFLRHIEGLSLLFLVSKIPKDVY